MNVKFAQLNFVYAINYKQWDAGFNKFCEIVMNVLIGNILSVYLSNV